jgi:hypothetical protein
MKHRNINGGEIISRRNININNLKQWRGENEMSAWPKQSDQWLQWLNESSISISMK